MRTWLLGAGSLVLVAALAEAAQAQVAEKVKVVEKKAVEVIYLSSLTPRKTNITPNLFDKGTASADKWYVYKDINLHMKPIKVGGTSYRYGLTLLPGVDLEYDLKGTYRDLTAVVGIDDDTKAEGEGSLVIEGDGQELARVPIVYRTVKGKDGKPMKPERPMKKVTVNVKDVKTLKVSFKAKDDLNGLSLNVSLGDAKFNK
jgi:hypothetical protein